jgi:hypothetical protein
MDYVKESPYGNGLRALPVVFGYGGWSVDQCAALAREKGFVVFAVQAFSECWVGAIADVAKMIAASRNTTDAECSNVPCAQGAPCTLSRNKVFFLEGMPEFNPYFQQHSLFLDTARLSGD